MKTNDVALSIINLANGAACEQFDYELGRVIRNIADPNTPAKKAREVTFPRTSGSKTVPWNKLDF
jgi:hypothetical protein